MPVSAAALAATSTVAAPTARLARRGSGRPRRPWAAAPVEAPGSAAAGRTYRTVGESGVTGSPAAAPGPAPAAAPATDPAPGAAPAAAGAAGDGGAGAAGVPAAVSA